MGESRGAGKGKEERRVQNALGIRPHVNGFAGEQEGEREKGRDR